MPSFNFTSGTGSSLTEKIAAINAMQASGRKSPKLTEEEAEDALMEQIESDKEESESPDAVETPSCNGVEKPYEPPHTHNSNVVDCRMDKVVESIEALTSEVKKINKHVNSIVKMMKKD